MNTHSELLQRIERLEEELYLSRYRTLKTLPNELGDILLSYYDCDTRDETYRWLENIAYKIIEKAAVIDSNSWQSTALCPLCKEGSQSNYKQGFTVPEGLRRHLVGFGRTHQCFFTETAIKLARKHWHNKFAEQEAEEAQQKQQQKLQRKATETLYQTRPFEEAVLRDEGWSIDEYRSDEDMSWANDRLELLGFNCVKEGRTLSWIDEKDSCVVYADPRCVGKITFEVWKKPLPKRKPKNTHRYILGRFNMLDSWKNDLQTKYEKRLAKIID